MKQAQELANKIKAMERICSNSNNLYLKRDLRKRINRDKKELKEYCSFKNINYYNLLAKGA